MNMNIAGFYRFDVHFFDGAEQNAHGFVYAENYANAVEKAETFRDMILAAGIHGDFPLVSFGSVIGTHLGEGAIAFGITPIIK